MSRPTIFNDRRSGRDRRSERPAARSDIERFLHGKGRFKRHSEIANSASTVSEDVTTDRRETTTDKRFDSERRSGRDRRSGLDTRSEIEQFLQGERRSRLDRRSRVKGGYQSFKKARAFVRSLGLKSMRKWDAYTKSGKKPDNIPAAPQEVYANDEWAGWNDWLGR